MCWCVFPEGSGWKEGASVYDFSDPGFHEGIGILVNKNCNRFRIVVGFLPWVEARPEFRLDDAEVVCWNCKSCGPLRVVVGVCGEDDAHRGGI